MDSTSHPLQLKIMNCEEIRMGSPYNACEIELNNLNNVELPKGGWQDKYAWSDDSKKLALIHWDLENNTPGFRFYIIDIETNNFQVSERIFGLVNDLRIIGNAILYNKFLYDKSRSEQGALCCNVDEEYHFV